MYLIGYDIGSSSIKASIVDAHSNKAIATVSYPDREMDMISRQKGWAEQQPELWWSNLCFATAKLLAKCEIDASEINGIGISYQMHGLVLVDKDLQVLRPSIIWCDSRAVQIGKKAFQDLGEQHCLSHYLNSPGNFTASKLKWVQDNEPQIYHRIHKVLLPGDYINMKLTGQLNTTISGLSEAVLWDFKEKRLATEVLAYYGISQSLIPEVTATFSLMGQVTKKAAAQTGLSVGTPVTYRAGDQPNNALSLNVLKKGEIAATSGTSGVVYGVVDRPLYDPQSRVNAFSHVNYEDKLENIGILLCINGAGIAYSWIKHLVAGSSKSYDDMERMATSVPVGSEGVSILPFGNGAERIFENRHLGSHIQNLDFNRHGRAHIYRATLESVAYSFVYGMNVMKEMGLDLDVIRVSNDNMFQSKIFSTTIATLLGNHIELVDTTGAVGAAKAAGVKAGVFYTIEEAMSSTKPKMVYEPDNQFGQYNQAYFRWHNDLIKRSAGSNSHSAKLQASYSDNEKLKRSLIEKTRDVTTSSIKIDGYVRLLSEVRSVLENVKDDKSSEEVKKLLKKIKSHSLADVSSQRDVFEEHFDILNDDFIKKLKVRYPTLTFDELKMCALLKMNLSSKEIAQKLNLSLRGIETKRYRIRKKMSLDRKVNLNQHFMYISH